MVYRFSVLPALSLTDSVLHCDIVEGAFDTATFYLFIERMLRFNLVRVEIRELRPEVVAEGDGVSVHYRGRTNV